MRTSPLERPVAPAAATDRSTTTTRAPRDARWNARLAPWTPAPMTMTSAVSVMTPSGVSARGQYPSVPGGLGMEHERLQQGVQVRAVDLALGREVVDAAVDVQDEVVDLSAEVPEAPAAVEGE